MNKTLALLVTLGLVALAQAEMVIKTPLTSFLKPRALLRTEHPHLQAGEVAWGSCACDGGFKVDLAKTKSDPLKPTKGISVKLILNGVWMKDVNLDAIKVYVEWNKTPLYVEEFPRGTDYFEGDSFSDTIGWAIPSFAPSGHYAVKITLHDKNTVHNFGCITADFDL